MAWEEISQQFIELNQDLSEYAPSGRPEIFEERSGLVKIGNLAMMTLSDLIEIDYIFTSYGISINEISYAKYWYRTLTISEGVSGTASTETVANVARYANWGDTLKDLDIFDHKLGPVAEYLLYILAESSCYSISFQPELLDEIAARFKSLKETYLEDNRPGFLENGVDFIKRGIMRNLYSAAAVRNMVRRPDLIESNEASFNRLVSEQSSTGKYVPAEESIFTGRTEVDVFEVYFKPVNHIES